MKSLTTVITLLSWAAAKVSAGKLSPTDSITWGGDNSRSGYETTHNMDPSVVGSEQFGQLWKANLPGNYKGYLEQIYSQPLLYTLDDGIQYVFIATTQNNVYKINAKTGTIVAQRNLHIPFLTQELVPCLDINPTVGVTATGVIDPTSDTWYLTAKTYEDQTDQVKGLDNGRYWFHAIDVNTLEEKTGFPKGIEGTIARNNGNRMFQSGIGHQRPALLHTGQYIYAGFASHCVQWNFTGWIMGWDKTTGNMVEAFTTEAGPEKNSVPGGGIWMSGGGLATDGRGSMYYSTGNGYASQLAGTPVPGRQPPTSLEEAAVNMIINDDGSLKVVDFFMPWEKVQLDGADKDLGTSPLILLQPDVFTCPNVKRMGVVTGKSGKTYILNIDNLGGYQMGANKLDAVPQVFQNENSVYAGAGVYPGEGGYIYINVIQYPTHAFKFSCNANGDPSFTKVADTPQKNAYVLGVGHGATTSLRGQAGSGLVWVTDVDGFNLRIYNAVPQNGVMTLIKSANIPGVTKFSRPVFGDGRAYVGTVQGALYCFGSPVNLPLTCSSPNDFGKQLINTTSAARTIQCQANINTQVTSMALKGNPNFKVTQQPTLPVNLDKGQNISFQAVFAPNSPGPLSSDVLVGTTNGVTGYSTSTPVSLKGNGDSLVPLLAVTPNVISFSGVITGEQAGGVTQSVIFSNNGDSTLHITSIGYSTISETGATVTPNTTTAGIQVGPFTFKGVPTTIPGNDQVTVDINFNPTESGNFAVYVTVQSDGGKKIFDVVATAGTYPKAVLEFQAADGSGRWIPYTSNSPPFTFGNVYEQKTKELKMRLTNNGTKSAAALSVTVSKPPFGVSGIVGANNGVDLAEGTILSAGESATATLYCSVPKSQVNSDSYNGSAIWTMNVGDPSFGKQSIQFTCNAITEQVGPLAKNGSAIYRYAGCWRENNPGRQLKEQLWGQNPRNDNGLCINACAAKGYVFAGTQYVDECWCGNTLPNQKSTETECNYQCSGDSTETCGGNGYFHDHSYLSLFTNGDPSTLPNTAGPGVVPSVGAYNYSGCYTEGTSGRALGDKAVSTSDMTVQRCAAECTDYTYFGIEYANECYCGNTLGVGSAKTIEGECSMNCPGNTTQICGSGSRLTLYTKGKTSVVSSSSSISSSTASISSSTSSISSSTSSISSSTSSISSSTSSISSSTSSISSSTSSISSSTSSISSSTSSISSSTSSSPSSTATGPVAVQSAGAFSYQGCYSEGTNGRALAATSTANTAMTVQKCATFCSDYQYMGVEYSSECYCANTIGAGATLQSSGCTMTCSGDAATLCGGPNRLNFYANTGGSQSSTSKSSSSTSQTLSSTSQSSSSTSQSSSSTSQTLSSTSKSSSSTSPSSSSTSQTLSSTSKSSSSTSQPISQSSTSRSSTSTSQPSSQPTGPVIVQKAGTFGYTGCYSEGTSARALSGKQTVQASMTVEQCSTFCTGYKYMGVEYGSECYCGDIIAAGSVLSDTGCTMTCTGDKTEYCGGPNRLNLYTAGAGARSSTSASSSTIQSSTMSSTSSSASPSSTKSSTSSSASQSSTKSSTSSSASQSSTKSSTSSSASQSSTMSSTSSSASPSSTMSSTSSSASPSSTKSSTSSSASPSSTMSSTSSSTSTSKAATASPTVVQSSSNFTYAACYTDGTTRSLANLVLASDTMTVEKCLSACQNYAYAGMEYGRECWCGDSLATTATQATAESQCNKPCPGDTTQICGAGNRLTLYTRDSVSSQARLGFVASSPSTGSKSFASSLSSSSSKSSSSLPTTASTSKSSSQTSSGSTTPASSTSASSTSISKTSSQSSSTISETTLLPTPSQTIAGYTYLGCANQTSPLALVGMSKSDSNEMTTETCQKYCLDNNYGLAGTKNGDTCYCGNGLQSYSAVGQKSCNVPCSGNQTEICGGATSLSLWNSTSSTIPPTTVKAVGAYPLLGCYSGDSILTAASYTSATGLTVESCVGHCITKGYDVASTQDGKTCYCDSKLATTATKEPLANCNVLCAGNTREFCGAYGKSLVYQYNMTSVTNGVPASMNQGNTATIKANSTMSG